MPASPVTLNLEADMAAVKPDTTTPSTTDGKKPASKGMRPEPYRVANVEKIASPDGLSGGTWYRYILDNDSSVITGQRCGSLKDVQAYAEQYASQLNARTVHGQSSWTPRRKKVAPPPA